jgi:hypothetical protein
MNQPHFTSPAAADPGTPQFLVGSTQESISTSSRVKKSGLAGRLGVGGLVAALAVGALFASRSALQGPAGPASSAEAVTQFFAALDNDDLVGLAEVVHPRERESIAQPLFDMVDHGKRLEVVSADTDMSQLNFIDFQVDGLTYSVEQTGPRLHYVTTTGGTVTVPDDPAFPAGPLLDRFDIDGAEIDGGVTTTDLGDQPMRMAVIEDDGSWYVSLWYSAAERARRDAGMAFPGVGTGPDPVGSATPDGVMEDLMAAAFDLDADRVLTLLDPVEAAALYDYSPMFMADVQTSLDEVRTQAAVGGFDWDLDSIDFVSAEANGRQLVNFNSMAASFSVESQGTTASGSITIDGGCSVITIDDEPMNSCDTQTGQQAAELERLGDELLAIAGLSDTTMNTFDKLTQVDRGITVVERDGRWYLSLMPTILETVNDHMAVLEPADLVSVGIDIEELVDDQDRVGEELVDLLLTADVGSLGSNLGPMNDFGSMLGTSSNQQFVPVVPVIDDPSVANTVEPEWTPFELGAIESVLVPHESAFPVDYDESYMAWEIDGAAAPAFVAGAYVVGRSESIEVLEFEAPVDPGLLDASTWSLEEFDGVVVATNRNFGEKSAFVGNYVVWSLSGASSDGIFVSQVTALK